MNNITAIILAAGKGTRLNSTNKNKVVKSIGGKPMISYTVDLLKQLSIKEVVVVVGFRSDSVKQVLGQNFTYITQESPLGTGHAVMTAIPHLKPSCQHALVLNGDDSAFYQPSDIKKLITTHQHNQSDMTLLTVIKQNPAQFGRIIRDQDNNVSAIVEFKNATKTQKQIKEINTATYCFKKDFLAEYISAIQTNPVSKEYYLTDLLEIAVKNHKTVSSVTLENPNRFHGINNLEELKIANQKMSQAS